MSMKNITVVDNTGNPVQMQDLQNIWSMLNAMGAFSQTGVHIVAGCDVINTNQISQGLISFNGQCYFLANGVASLSSYLFALEYEADSRVYEDGSTHYFYSNYIINASNDPNASGLGIPIGQATLANLNQWKSWPLADASVTTAKIADNAVTNAKIADNAVSTTKIRPGQITNSLMAANSVSPGNIINGAVTSEKIATRAVKYENLDAKAVHTDNIDDKAVTTDKLANNSVRTAQILNSAVTYDKLAANAVHTENILDGSILYNKYASESIGSAKIAPGGIQTKNLKDACVTLEKMATNSVSTNQYVDYSITNTKLALRSVGTPSLVNLAVTNEKIADKTITGAKIADKTINTPQLALDAVAGYNIAESTISSRELDLDCVKTDKIKNAAVTTSKIAPKSITVPLLDAPLIPAFINYTSKRNVISESGESVTVTLTSILNYDINNGWTTKAIELNSMRDVDFTFYLNVANSVDNAPAFLPIIISGITTGSTTRNVHCSIIGSVMNAPIFSVIGTKKATVLLAKCGTGYIPISIQLSV